MRGPTIGSQGEVPSDVVPDRPAIGRADPAGAGRQAASRAASTATVPTSAMMSSVWARPGNMTS